MSRPPTVAHRVKVLHATLTQALGQGASIDRQTWDRIVARHFELGYEMTASLTRAGELLGYWQRVMGKTGGKKGGRKPGQVVLIEQATPTPTPSPTNPSQTPS